MVIYAIVNLRTQRAYIGRSSRAVRRWYEHCRLLRMGRHPSTALQADWARDGAVWFSCITLEALSPLATKSDAAAREKWHLEQVFEPYNQSQFTLSGPNPGTPLSLSARANLSAALKGKPKTLAHREALSASRRGVPNPAHSARMKGRIISTATRDKMRLAHLGMIASPESRAKRSATLKGRVFTQEWKDRIRDAKTGVPWSQKRLDASRPQLVVAEGVSR